MNKKQTKHAKLLRWKDAFESDAAKKRIVVRQRKARATEKRAKNPTAERAYARYRGAK